MTLIISVSGIRGTIGEGLTPQVACNFGCAFGTFLRGGRVVIGRDTRPSGPMIGHALIAGLSACGCEVIDLGIVSTPGVALMVRRLSAAGGVVITASHNPQAWNGIKFLSSEGWAFPPEVANTIRQRYEAADFHLKDAVHTGNVFDNPQTHQYHVEAVLESLDVERIRQRKFKVVLDSINGAGGAGGAMLLHRLGCELIHENAEPSGLFAHTPEPTVENLTSLCDAVRAHRADIGFAQDPDADRLAMVDETGTYIGEEYTLALAARHIFASRPGPAAANLSTSRMLDDLAAAAGTACKVYRTPVGEAHVARAIILNHCVIGGEGNGGVIDPRIVPVRDSFTAMGLTLDLLAASGKTLNAVVSEIPRYTMIKQKFPCTLERAADVLAEVRKAFASERINDADGIRIDWPEGWVHVRASNTEPIMRIIAEAKDQPTAERLTSRIRDVAQRILKT